MLRVCAWCRLFLGLKRPLDRWEMTHGICRECEARFNTPPGPFLMATAPRILIVARDPIALEAAGELVARAGHSVRVLADRRQGDRRRRQLPVAVDRRRGDRRAAPPESWARGYLVIDPAADPEIAALAVGSAALL